MFYFFQNGVAKITHSESGDVTYSESDNAVFEGPIQTSTIPLVSNIGAGDDIHVTLWAVNGVLFLILIFVIMLR